MAMSAISSQRRNGYKCCMLQSRVEMVHELTGLVIKGDMCKAHRALYVRYKNSPLLLLLFYVIFHHSNLYLALEEHGKFPLCRLLPL